MTLSALFSLCLSVPYRQTGVSANYAYKRIGDTLYLFFEHSVGGNDWKHNLDFPAKPYKRMGKTVWFAHRGFLNAWKHLQPVLEKEIADESVRRIVTAGYSHGGALALLCHEYVWYHRPDLRSRIEGYGFGCPRVLWGIKSKSVRARWQRFTIIRNLDDIVTHLPPAVLGYTHVGKMLKIGKRGNYSASQAHYAENIATELQLYENGVETSAASLTLLS